MAPTLSGTDSTSSATGCDTVTSDDWQNSCDDANFTWSGATDTSSGIDSYLAYWGTSASGTPTTPAAGAAFNPGSIASDSTYYLRAIAIDKAGKQSAPATLFILKYDNTPPTAPPAS